MITKLSIANFKSVRQLDIDCKKVNLFIGEPNTGKSNILEALGLLGWLGQPGDVPLRDSARFQTMPNLFYTNCWIRKSQSGQRHPMQNIRSWMLC